MSETSKAKAEPTNHPTLIKTRLDSIAANVGAPSEDEKAQSALEIKEEIMAGLLIISPNQKRFGLLKRDIQNSYLKGQDDYLKTFEDAKRLLSNWKAHQTNNYEKPLPRSDGVAFIQSGDKPDGDKATTTAGKQKKTNSKDESHCYNSECPEEQRAELARNERNMLMNVQAEMDMEDGVSLLNVMLLNRSNGLSDDRLYLDNCYTVTAGKNK